MYILRSDGDGGYKIDVDNDGTFEIEVSKEGSISIVGDLDTEGSFGGGTLRVEVTTTGSLSDAQVRSTFVTNYAMSGATDTTLPAYVGSTMCTVLVEAAGQDWSLKPPSGEAFILDGVTLDADNEIDVGDVVGDMLNLIRIRTGASTYQWYTWTVSGTHTDGGAS